MTEARIIGIDPGKTGSIAFIHGDQVDFKEFEDIRALYDQVVEWNPDYAIIEKVHSMPGQGVASTFKFAYYAGLAEGLVLGLGIPYEFVRPQEWQKGLFGISDGTDKKQRSVNAAKRIIPQASPWLKRKKDHNRADALLIARYGLLKHQRKVG